MAITKGVGTYFRRPPTVKGGVDLRIGSYTSIGENLLVNGEGGGHHPEWVTTFTRYRLFGKRVPIPKPKPVVIGSDVWIGHDCTLRPGVEIGHGAVIGAKSVVRGAIPPYAIAIGNPCTVVKFRFPHEQIEALLEIAWWEWPDEVVRERADDLFSGDIEGFIRKYA